MKKEKEASIEGAVSLLRSKAIDWIYFGQFPLMPPAMPLIPPVPPCRLGTYLLPVSPCKIKVTLLQYMKKLIEELTMIGI